MTTNTEPKSAKSQQDFEFMNIKTDINFTYTWTINQCSQNYFGLFWHDSPIFSNEADDIKWRLRIENDKSRPEVCFVKLCFASSNIKKIQATCKFRILEGIFENTTNYFKTVQFTHGEYSTCINIPASVLTDTLREYVTYITRESLLAVQLKVNCEINVREISTMVIIPKCNLADNLKLMFENRKLTDVTLCVSGKDFQAHKAILAARSPVFSAMFEHDMKENQDNRVDITDINSEVFEEFLRFIYTGEVLNLESIASDLLPAAEKYEFEKLKVLCGKVICSNISLENAAEALVLTDMYNLDTFKAVVLGYICNHVEVVCKTTGWISLERSHQHLIKEVIRDVSQTIAP